MATQLTIDFTQRGQQLRVLAKCVLPSVNVGQRPTSGASLKAVLRGLDDCIGAKKEWTISIPHLCQQSGRSRAVVSAALAALNSLYLITIDRHFDIVDGRAEQKPSTYSIVWTNVLDYVQEKVEPKKERRKPQTVTLRRPADATTEVGGLSLRLGYAHSEMGVISECDGGSLSLRLGYAHSETLTAPRPPVTANNSPPTAAPINGRRGRLWGWMDKKTFLKAVSRGDSDLIKRLCLEAVEAGALTDSDDSRRALAAACYDVRECDSPVGVLMSRLTSGDVSCDAVPESAIEWADLMLGKAATKPTAQSQVGQAGGCRICHATQNPDKSGCAACNPSKRDGAPVRGLQRGERRTIATH